MKIFLFVLAICIAFVSGSDFSKLVPRGSPIDHPDSWKFNGYPKGSSLVTLFFALKQNNIEQIEEIALEVSDPDHPKYGKHLSLEEVSEIVSPEPTMIKTLMRWLLKQGVEEISLSGTRSFLKIKVTVEAAEKLLGCQFKSFLFVATKDEPIIRCEEEYFLPEEFSEFVEFVAPVHGFPSKTHRSQREDVLEAGRTYVQHVEGIPLPNVSAVQILARYNVSTQTNNHLNNTQAVYEFNNAYLLSDLALFFDTYLPYLKGQTVLKFLGNESNNSSYFGTEADLDIQLLMGIGQYGPTYSYNYGGSDIFYSFYQWAFDLDSDPKPPLVHSNSWGPTGGGYPIPEIVRASNELAKLAARGLSILIASGDDGPGCYGGAPFEVAYPSTPWVTIIGSTEMQSTGPKTFTEIASNFSSGGFSNYWTMPKWQKNAVSAYLQANAKNLPPPQWYNSSKRAFPDISAVGENTLTIQDGVQSPVSGTSCAAPIVTGIFSLLTAIRLKAGKSPLGYLNPLLYKVSVTNPELFFDVTAGSDDQGDGCPYWIAAKGWDPVTGLGTPNYATWSKFVLTLP